MLHAGFYGASDLLEESINIGYPLISCLLWKYGFFNKT